MEPKTCPLKCARVTTRYYKSSSPKRTLGIVPEPPPKLFPYPSAPSSPCTVGKAKPKKKRRRKIASRHTQTVAAAAEWIDGVTGSSHHPKTHPAAATVFHLWKIIEMDMKARRIT
jgi:hypothetical protein